MNELETIDTDELRNVSGGLGIMGGSVLNGLLQGVSGSLGSGGGLKGLLLGAAVSVALWVGIFWLVRQVFG